MSARFTLRFIFALQIAIAMLLLWRDFSAVAPGLRWPSLAPSFAPDVGTPVRPGDQTRRFDPAKLPSRPAQPGQNLPASTDMPSRLFFEERPGGGTQITGTIREGDAERFETWLKTQVTAPKAVWLNSPGGSVSDALRIGRLLREKGIETAMDAGDICLSACPYILMGGSERRLNAQAAVGVHQHYYGENVVQPAFLAVEDIQRSQAEVISYLDQMGISPLLMQHSLATPPDEIYILVEDELTTYAVATQITR